jgi:hypothetical protein
VRKRWPKSGRLPRVDPAEEEKKAGRPRFPYRPLQMAHPPAGPDPDRDGWLQIVFLLGVVALKGSSDPILCSGYGYPERAERRR